MDSLPDPPRLGLGRIGRLALTTVCVATCLLAVLPPALVRLNRHALSRGDRVNTEHDGLGEIESVEGETVFVRVAGQLREVPRSEVSEL